MSLEIFNPENRNAGFNLPTRRCCSFCRQQGHNISRCNDIRLREFETECLRNYRDLTEENEFRNWLTDYSTLEPNIVRAYAVRNCDCSVKSYMFVCIEQIIRRMRSINNENVEEDEVLDDALEEQVEPQTNSSEDRNSRIIELVISLALGQRQRQINPQDLLVAMMFMEMFDIMYNKNTDHRRFNIERRVVQMDDTSDCECNICYESFKKDKFVKVNCGHEFCKDCMKQTLQNVISETPQCAYCRKEINSMELSSEEIVNEFNNLIS
jgi:hypothetical protein